MLYDRLRGRLFLSSMMGTTDGRFCGERSGGCAMVQLGAYLAEPPAYDKVPLVLPPNRIDCIRFLQGEFDRVKFNSDVILCVNVATPELTWGMDAAEYISQASAVFELNIHGGYEPYLRRGRIRAMVYPESRNELFDWLESFSRLEIPVIVKFREGVIDDYTPILDKIKDLDLLGVHFNVRDEKTKRPDFEFVEDVKRVYDTFMLVSGYVRSADDARRLFQAGADMVGIAEPTMQDPDYIRKIAEEL
jgi:tRNA-dihydrouridine synthase